jgi:hypothetical protein
MTLAMMNFTINNPLISTPEQKFSEAGHSNIQQVDEIHLKVKITFVKMNYLVQYFMPADFIK